jgi:hypothetical protein
MSFLKIAPEFLPAGSKILLWGFVLPVEAQGKLIQSDIQKKAGGRDDHKSGYF